jgi:MarR family transcriptional regulator, temperature-dependent positive regulator of motility
VPPTRQILTDESRYRLLKLLDDNPELSQRELAEALDISLGKTNYCVRALVERGWVKVVNFRNSERKVGYLYQLTPTGIAEKARATRRFLGRKIMEYELLESEIAALRREVEGTEAISEKSVAGAEPNN